MREVTKRVKGVRHVRVKYQRHEPLDIHLELAPNTEIKALYGLERTARANTKTGYAVFSCMTHGVEGGKPLEPQSWVTFQYDALMPEARLLVALNKQGEVLGRTRIWTPQDAYVWPVGHPEQMKGGPLVWADVPYTDVDDARIAMLRYIREQGWYHQAFHAFGSDFGPEGFCTVMFRIKTPFGEREPGPRPYYDSLHYYPTADGAHLYHGSHPELWRVVAALHESLKERAK